MKALALSSVLGGGPGQRLQIQTSHGLRGYSAKVRLWSCRRQGPHSGGCADRRGDQLRFATGCPGRDVPREFIGQGMTLAPTLSNNMSEQVGTDRALIDQARAGDEAALRTLIERYEPQVAATVVGMLGPGDEADDVGQETFVRFYQSLDKFRGDAALSTYLTRIAINLSLNALERRKRQRWRFWSRDDEQAPPEPSVDGRDEQATSERAQAVQAALNQLKPAFRAVVLLRMIEGYSTKETAALLEIAEGTVLSRLSRGMKQLETILTAEDLL